MARKKTTPFFVDMDGDTLRVGSRVELHPGMDLWMRGAKYGTITSVRDGKPCVRMDNPRVKRLVCTVSSRLKRR